jgi:DNA-directed RNA polymerase subunit M/transcription elongation factor TFIIS
MDRRDDGRARMFDMAEPPPGTPTYPVVCPRCHAREGVPFRASTVKDQPRVTRVEIRCAACQHKWAEDVLRDPGTSIWG